MDGDGNFLFPSSLSSLFFSLLFFFFSFFFAATVQPRRTQRVGEGGRVTSSIHFSDRALYSAAFVVFSSITMSHLRGVYAATQQRDVYYCERTLARSEFRDGWSVNEKRERWRKRQKKVKPEKEERR